MCLHGLLQPYSKSLIQPICSYLFPTILTLSLCSQVFLPVHKSTLSLPASSVSDTSCFYQITYLRSSYALPLLLLKTMAKGCHTALCLSVPATFEHYISLCKAIAEVPSGRQCLHSKGHSCARLACDQPL